jgi:hypothetical protein
LWQRAAVLEPGARWTRSQELYNGNRPGTAHDYCDNEVPRKSAIRFSSKASERAACTSQNLAAAAREKGSSFPPEGYERLARELTERFGGVTAFARSPAEGRWRNDSGTEHDDIVSVEAMAERLDRRWLSELRSRLMREFAQDDIVIRSYAIERLT